jgi:ABC-type nitrate/sulfonate/bicarbonate transport system ATPase subunit
VAPADAVDLRGVGFAFSGAPPLFDGFDLQLLGGEITAVIGASGSGKSTLLRLVLGLLRPQAGSVQAPVGARAMVPQQPTLLPWRSVLDNVALPLELQGVAGEERQQHARRALAQVELEGVERQLPHALSGGMRMRVSLARALVTEPILLGLDEPFAALDALTRRRVRAEFLRAWQARPCTTLFVTHDLEEAVLLSHRVVVVGGRPLRLLFDEPVGASWPREPAMLHERAQVEQVARILALL